MDKDLALNQGTDQSSFCKMTSVKSSLEVLKTFQNLSQTKVCDYINKKLKSIDQAISVPNYNFNNFSQNSEEVRDLKGSGQSNVKLRQNVAKTILVTKRLQNHFSDQSREISRLIQKIQKVRAEPTPPIKIVEQSAPRFEKKNPTIRKREFKKRERSAGEGAKRKINLKKQHMQCRKETTLRTINLEENISLKSEFSCYSTGTSKKTVEHQSMTRMQTNDLQNSSNSNFKEQLELDINDGDKLDEILLMEDDTYQDIFTQQKNILNIVECDYEMEEPLENHFNLEVPGYERGLQQIGRGFPLAIKNLKQEQNLSQYHAKQRSSML